MSLGRLTASIRRWENLQAPEKSYISLRKWIAEKALLLDKDFSKEAALLRACKTKKELRHLIRHNLFILLSCGCNRGDMLNKWCYDRSVEIQESPDNHLDMWPRTHYKSTIITFGKSIQDIFLTHGADFTGTHVTLGIFSYTRPLAKQFLRQIKHELERNMFFKTLFPDILYLDPKKDAPKWSEDEGIVVQRLTNPKESTIEAWGLAEGQPTSKHFQICIYDDIITREAVRTFNSIHQITSAWEESLNLCSNVPVRRYIGTRKHFNDTYSVILDRKAAIPRLYTPYTTEGKSVLKEFSILQEDRRQMGEVTWAKEMMQNPILDSSQQMDVEDLQYHTITDYTPLNLYMICDAAGSKKKTSDYTAYIIIGVDAESNILLIDGLRDRLNLCERWEAFLKLYSLYPNTVTIYYEEVGMQDDIAHFKSEMMRIGRLFGKKIVKLNPRTKKEARINELATFLSNKSLFIPKKLVKMRENGESYDLVEDLKKEEMAHYPLSAHDDILDCLGYAATLILHNVLEIPDNNPKEPTIRRLKNVHPKFIASYADQQRSRTI